MRQFLLSALIAGVALTVAACNKGEATKKELKTDTEKFSYAIGMDIGRSLKRLDTPVDTMSLRQGVQDVLDDKPTLLTAEQVTEVMTAASKKIQEAQQQKAKDMGAKNLVESQKFLAENAKKEGVQTTKSGLQYQVITEGKGPKPKATDRVSVNYVGTLVNGEKFDSSYDRHEPATFPLNAVIPGWTEGLQLMTVGSKYKLWIPPELGYGERGAGPKIGPNSALIFEVELLSIDNGKPAAPAAPSAPAAKKK
jgi:FKBP-type peptidyl-prolyl cis-trans isomerase